MNIYDSFGLLAGILQIIGYIWYTRYVFKEHKCPGSGIKPNTGSWLIWTYGNAIVCLNYITLGGLTFKEALPLLCSAACIIVAVIFFFLKEIERPSRLDIVILVADLCITIYWFVTGETLITYILLQLSVGISYIPIIIETWKSPNLERSGPWIIWSIAYALLLIAQLPEGFWKYIYPVNYFVWTSALALIVFLRKPSLAK